MQPFVSEYAESGVEDAYLLKFVPFNLKAASDYLLEMGPHTVLEGFDNYELFEMKDNVKLLAGQPPAEEADLVDLNENLVAPSYMLAFHCYSKSVSRRYMIQAIGQY